MPEDMSDRMPEDMPDRMPEDLPDRMPEDMPEDMPDRMPEDMPDRMPNRLSEDMSDRMPEDLPVRKCINVMVGITRSKVIFFHLALMLQICPSALGPGLLHLNCRITIVRSQNSHFVKVCVPLLVVASANAAINDFEMLLVDRWDVSVKIITIQYSTKSTLHRA